MALPKIIGRNIDPSNPAWGVSDELAAVQNRLGLLVARPLMKGQGAVTDSERAMVTDAIGNLSKASGTADYQFRLNSIGRMIEDMNSGGKMKPLADYSAKPSIAEIQGVVDTNNGTFSTSGIQALGEKYNTRPYDMQKYVLDMYKSSTQQGGSGNGAELHHEVKKPEPTDQQLIDAVKALRERGMDDNSINSYLLSSEGRL